MTQDFNAMPFTGSLTDPEEIEWQLSLGGTALDRVTDSRFNGLPAVEACLRLLCELHAADSGRPSATEERSLRLLVEDALGGVTFQNDILPDLCRVAIEFNNSYIVSILLAYAEDEKRVLALANAEDPEGGSGAE